MLVVSSIWNPFFMRMLFRWKQYGFSLGLAYIEKNILNCQQAESQLSIHTSTNVTLVVVKQKQGEASVCQHHVSEKSSSLTGCERSVSTFVWPRGDAWDGERWSSGWGAVLGPTGCDHHPLLQWSLHDCWVSASMWAADASRKQAYIAARTPHHTHSWAQMKLKDEGCLKKSDAIYAEMMFLNRNNKKHLLLLDYKA